MVGDDLKLLETECKTLNDGEMHINSPKRFGLSVLYDKVITDFSS